MEMYGVPLSLLHLQECPKDIIIKEQINLLNAIEICSRIKSITIQFKEIRSLDLCWLLVNVTTLCLNNNELTDTKGLEKLKQLQSLDLSFNKITNIDHLKGLSRLQILALHKNRISKLNENVFLTMKSLQVITLSNNQIQDVKDVLIFGRLESLQCLTMRNNPCTRRDYPSYIIAHVPHLLYLDYRRISEEDKKFSSDMHSESLLKVQSENNKRKEEEERLIKLKEEEEYHKMAGVYALNDDSLFNKLFEGSIEMKTLIPQNGVQALIERFKEQFKRICMALFEEGLLHASNKKKELSLVEDAIVDAVQSANEVARRLVLQLEYDIDILLKKAKLVIDEEPQSEDQEKFDERGRKINELREKVENTLDVSLTNLFEHELILANQIKDVLEKAEEELGSLVTEFLSEAAEHCAEARRYAYVFYCRLRELTTKLADAALNVSQNGTFGASDSTGTGETKKDPDDEINTKIASEIFEGGDTLTVALAKIHDLHLDVISQREEELKTHLTVWLEQKLEVFYRQEWRRHRTRLEEIATLSDVKRKEINKVLPLDMDELL